MKQVDIYKEMRLRIGKTVVFYRQDRGLSQKALCALTGLKSNASISQIESGDFAPSWSTLAALCEAFNVSVTDFFETFNKL